MENKESVLEKVTQLISEIMGQESGELFHKFYELDDNDDIFNGAHELLSVLIGPEMTDKKLKKLGKKS
ncbi:MAG TPA: hypothetical protein VLF79_03445 [Candidatus Saccharimonadales bacterium]|nr:hypothetical protein [Candidatus Saccharimonadales bacterium]